MSVPHYYEYRIKPGETLSLIIVRFYNIGPSSHNYKKCIENILALNPHVKNPNLIREGSVLKLMPTPIAEVQSTSPANKTEAIPPLLKRPYQHSPGSKSEGFMLDNVSKEDEANFHLLSNLAMRSEFPLLGVSAAAAMYSGIVQPRITQSLNEINTIYVEYKNGNITRGQYDYRRKLLINEIKHRVGPLDNFLFGSKANQAIRIARGGGIPATYHITQNADKLKKLATYGRNGGYILAGASIAAGCIQIAEADSRQEKNEILVETIAGTTAGLLAGAAVGLFLVSNPIGWGVALTIAAGSAVASYGAGKASRYAYTISGSKVDLVSGMGVDRICK
jgi:hypothetical protein